MDEMKTILTAFMVSTTTCLTAIGIFWGAFHVKPAIGVCEKHGWRMEGTGAYQAKHCYDPASRLMYLPPEIAP